MAIKKTTTKKDIAAKPADMNAHIQEEYEKMPVVRSLATIEGIDAFLNGIKKEELVAYFNSPAAAQDNIKGRYQAFAWLHAEIKKTRKPSARDEEVKPQKSPRHA